jgi:hypothetical protein
VDSPENDSSFLTPTAGFDKLMRDPCITIGLTGNSTWCGPAAGKSAASGMPVSPDLINWSEQKYVMVKEKEDSAQIAGPLKSCSTMCCRNTSFTGQPPSRPLPETENMGDYNHRIYYTTTSDFETSATHSFYTTRDSMLLMPAL